MKRTVWADEQVTALVNKTFIPVTIDVDDSESAAVRSRYSVGITPSTIITDSKGNVLQQSVGGVGKAKFLEMLGSSSGGADLGKIVAPVSTTSEYSGMVK